MPTEQHEVKLCKHDIDTCIEFTKLHIEEVKNRGLKNKFELQKSDSDFQIILQGYLGERAVGLYFDYSTMFVPYSTLPKAEQPADVLGYEVRTVKYKDAQLITRIGDKVCEYICVSIPTGTTTATIKGWSGYERTLTQANWDRTLNWQGARRCYSMLETDLWPMEMLPATPELIAHQQTVYA